MAFRPWFPRQLPDRCHRTRVSIAFPPASCCRLRSDYRTGAGAATQSNGRFAQVREWPFLDGRKPRFGFGDPLSCRSLPWMLT